jgi:hypothetical protein
MRNISYIQVITNVTDFMSLKLFPTFYEIQKEKFLALRKNSLAFCNEFLWLFPPHLLILKRNHP